MEYNKENVRNLEQLLESLIKMVGKSNQKIDNLQTRVNQLEWLIREQQLIVRDSSTFSMYASGIDIRQVTLPLHL